jgi:hypothetical protein
MTQETTAALPPATGHGDLSTDRPAGGSDQSGRPDPLQRVAESTVIVPADELVRRRAERAAARADNFAGTLLTSA